MLIKLETNLLQNRENLPDIIYLLRMFFDRQRHRCFVELPFKPGTREVDVSNVPLYEDLLEEDKELVLRYYDAYINNSESEDYTISGQASNNAFNLLEAKRFFNQPLVIILENSLNDGKFVDILLKKFPDESQEIQRHKSNGWLEYGNGGGCTNIPNFIEAKKTTFNNLPKASEKYLRYFVLIDSDKKFPSDALRYDKEDLRQDLEQNNIPYHILEKREIENYVPDEALKELAKSDKYIEAYLSLNPKQKDYFDLEKGFPNKNFNDLFEGIRILFEDIEGSNEYKIFRKHKKDQKFKSEFPKYFEKATQKGLKNRVAYEGKEGEYEGSPNPNELEDILEKITKLL